MQSRAHKMLEHWWGLLAGFLVAVIAIVFKRRETVAPKVLEVVKTATESIKADKIAQAEETHDETLQNLAEVEKAIINADLEALAKMAEHEFGSD